MVAKKICLLNKYPRCDSNNKDMWFKTILTNIPYSKQQITSVNGTTVSMGEVFTILIPFNDLYLPYFDWRTLADKTKNYTVNQGDLIFLNTDLSGYEITNENIIKIKNQFKPCACEVKSFEEVEKKLTANYQIKVSGV